MTLWSPSDLQQNSMICLNLRLLQVNNHWFGTGTLGSQWQSADSNELLLSLLCQCDNGRLLPLTRSLAARDWVWDWQWVWLTARCCECNDVYDWESVCWCLCHTLTSVVSFDQWSWFYSCSNEISTFLFAPGCMTAVVCCCHFVLFVLSHLSTVPLAWHHVMTFYCQ